MKYKICRLLCIFSFALVVTTACNSTTPVTSRVEQPPLTISYNPWPGYFPLAIAKEKGFFQQQGVKVEAIYSESYLTPLSDFSAGKYDGVGMSLGSVMNVIEKNSNAQIVIVTDQSAGADVIVANRDIQSVAGLKGKRIGIKLNDFGELFVSKMLQKNGLTTNDVKLVNLEGEMIPSHLQSGDIQAGHTWEPYVLGAVKSGAKVLFTSKQTPGLIPDVIVFRSDVVRDRPNDIKAFIKAWFQAQDYWKAHPEESKTLIAKGFPIKPEEVSTDGIKVATLKDNLKTFAPGSTEESLYYTAKLYADFYIRTGGLSSAPDIEKLLNPSFVQQLQQEN